MDQQKLINGTWRKVQKNRLRKIYKKSRKIKIESQFYKKLKLTLLQVLFFYMLKKIKIKY